MSEDNIFNSLPKNTTSDCFKDAIYINTSRIFDSCSSKDCAKNLPIYFTDSCQALINRCSHAKIQKINILDVSLDLDQIPFNNGFFSIDITFYLETTLNVTEPALRRPTTVSGLSIFSKKVILFGGSSNIKTFSSKKSNLENNLDCLPTATLQVSDPISLSLEIFDFSSGCLTHNNQQILNIPKHIDSHFDGEFSCMATEKIIYITVGLFSIIQLERPSQIMVPVYEFQIPNKDCNCFVDSPCELFKKLSFPTKEFFPSSISDYPDHI